MIALPVQKLSCFMAISIKATRQRRKLYQVNNGPNHEKINLPFNIIKCLFVVLDGAIDVPSNDDFVLVFVWIINGSNIADSPKTVLVESLKHSMSRSKLGAPLECLN